MKRVGARLNAYFFGVEPDEPIDWASILIFYGVAGFGLLASVLVWIV